MSTTEEDLLGVEKRVFRIERKVVQYQPEKFNALARFLYQNGRIVINWAGPVSKDGKQTWIHFRNRGDDKETFVQPGEFLVIDERGNVTAHVTDVDFPASV